MTTSREEYLLKAHLLTSGNPLRVALQMPENEPVYNIDLNSRIVQTPEFIGTTNDHNAEFIYFSMDRYYENMDMSTTVGLIQYINKNAKLPTGAKDPGHAYFIPYYDCISVPGKIIFPWLVGGPATAAAGPVDFSIRFYEIDPNGKEFSFKLSTLTATTQVLQTMNVIEPNNENLMCPPSELERLISEVKMLKEDWDLYWEDLYN